MIRTVLATIVGLLTPLSVTSKTLMIHELRIRNVQSHLIPMNCIAELANDNLKWARGLADTSRQIRGERVFARDALVHRTMDVADRIAEIFGIKPIDRFDGMLEREDRAVLEILLKRHGLTSAART